MDKEIAKIRAKLDILEQELRMVAEIIAGQISEMARRVAISAFDDYARVFKMYCDEIDKGEKNARD